MTLLAGNPYRYRYYLHAIVDNPHQALDTDATMSHHLGYMHNGAAKPLLVFYISVMYDYSFNSPIMMSAHYYLSATITSLRFTILTARNQ